MEASRAVGSTAGALEAQAVDSVVDSVGVEKVGDAVEAAANTNRGTAAVVAAEGLEVVERVVDREVPLEVATVVMAGMGVAESTVEGGMVAEEEGLVGVKVQAAEVTAEAEASVATAAVEVTEAMVGLVGAMAEAKAAGVQDSKLYSNRAAQRNRRPDPPSLAFPRVNLAHTQRSSHMQQRWLNSCLTLCTSPCQGRSRASRDSPRLHPWNQGTLHPQSASRSCLSSSR